MITPLPITTGPFQPGITDPQWSIAPPESMVDRAEQQRYKFERAGASIRKIV